KALSTTRFLSSAISPFSPSTASGLIPCFSKSASIKSSHFVSFFSLVIFLYLKVMTPHTNFLIPSRHFCQPVFRDLVTMAAVGGARPETTLLPGAQAALPHEPGHPVLAAAMTQLAEIEPHARATIGVSALFKALNDQGSQFDVFFATLTVLFAAMRGGLGAVAPPERPRYRDS